MRHTVVLLSIAHVGCGNSPAGNPNSGASQEANYIADQFNTDCRSATAPNAKAAKELDELCSCSTNQIRSTIHDGDSRAVTDKKIDEARMDCLKKVYPNG